MIKQCDYGLKINNREEFVDIQRHYQRMLGLKLVEAKDDMKQEQYL